MARAALIAAMMLAAAGAQAEPMSPWDVYISAAAGYGSMAERPPGVPAEDFDGTAVQFRASGSYVLPIGIGIQGDALYDHQEVDATFLSLDLETFDSAVHLFYRDPERFLIGALFQYGQTEAHTPSIPSFDRLYIGGEGQLYFGNLTLHGQGGHQKLDFPFWTPPIDGHFLNAQIRYFVTPNWLVRAGGGFDKMDFAGLFIVDTWKAGASTEFRPDGTPVSLFLNVDYETTEVSMTGIPVNFTEIEDVRVLAGLKLNFGAATLLERDRNGSSLDPMRTNETTSLYGGLLGLTCGCGPPP